MADNREDEIIEAAATQARPAAFVCVNLQNFKPFNLLLGYQKGDQFLKRLQQRLGEIGRTWRTGSNEFVVLVGGAFATVSDQLRAFSWRFHAIIGGTEAWSFRFADGRTSPTVPWRNFLVVCTPRCGLAELGSNASESLEVARRRCEDLRNVEPALQPQGFAPLANGPWTNERNLAVAACPTCGQVQPAIIEEDLGWSQERCSRCDASYERINILSVLGEEFESGYL
jgi:GGDEF domain-containing protein